jgi:zinc protease
MVRFQINVGSLEEADDQRGLAHFLEHMAFNGSINVPEGEMVRLLEREGLAFGADTNASTSQEATSYRLDLPRNTAALIDTALMLMRETASNLTISPGAVDRERGVVLAEMRARDSYAYRNYLDQTAFFYPGARLNDRQPIGTEAVITGASTQRIRDFYERYYRPERATLVIVGDFDVAAVEAQVRARFADWQGRGIAGSDAEPGPFMHDRAAAADVYIHPALPETVYLVRTRAQPRQPDSAAQRRRYQLEGIGEAIIGRRLSTIALSPDAPFLNASVSETGAWDRFRMLQLYATVRDGQWAAALRVVENEYRRALEHGFTDAEVAEQVAQRRTAYRNAVAGAATRQSASLAAELLETNEGFDIYTTPLTDLAAVEPVLAEANGASVTAAFRAMVEGFGAPQIRVTAKSAITGGPAAVLAAYDDATRLAVSPLADRAVQQFAYTDFGPAGRVVADDRIADLGIRRVRFANNVMLNIRPSDFEDDRVRIRVRLDGGSLLAPREDPLRIALANLMPLGGLAAHSADDLRTILAGRSVTASFVSGTDSFDLAAITTPADFRLQLQLLAAGVRCPGYRPEAITLFRRAIPQQYAQADASPGAVIGRQVPAILSDNDPRTMVPPLAAMLALEWDGTRSAMADALANGAIEIAIVGDIAEDEAISAVAATFGALPVRRDAFDPRNDQRVRRFASDLTPRTLYHRGEPDQAVALVYWPARDDADQREAIGIELLAQVMQLLLTEDLRERLGRSYSPDANASLSSDFPGYGLINAGASVAYADLAAAETSIDAMAARLRDSAITDDLLNRARTPMLERMAAARRTNAYWLGYAAIAASEPERLDRSRTAPDIARAVTPADIQRLAQTYLREDRRLRIRVVSREAAGMPAEAGGVVTTTASE